MKLNYPELQTSIIKSSNNLNLDLQESLYNLLLHLLQIMLKIYTQKLAFK